MNIDLLPCNCVSSNTKENDRRLKMFSWTNKYIPVMLGNKGSTWDGKEKCSNFKIYQN